MRNTKEYRNYFNTPKYKNKKTIVDNIKFDSSKEARRYLELKALKSIGEIENLELQPRFLLQPEYIKDGKKIRAIYYIADFKYIDKETGREIIEDVKGMKTEVYKLKKKLFEYKYPEYTIVEI